VRRRSWSIYPSRLAEPRRPTSRHGLSSDSPLLGSGPAGDGYDPQTGVLDLPPEPTAGEPVDLRELRGLVPAAEPGREVDDWGRSQRVFDLIEPLLDFYYRHWFRVEVEGVENVPSSGGALIVSNHSGALPPDAPMVMHAIRSEHQRPRPLYMLGEHWFKGYPGIGMLTNKLGLVAAHPANAQRLLRDEGRLAIVFPEGQKGTRKVLWQRYRLRRFGRGGFVRTAIRARVPIVPIAVIGAEEAMPIFAHIRPLQRISGLIYAPLNHAFPWFGLAAGAMYLPAKFKIRFLDPIDMSEVDPETADDAGAIQAIAEDIRGRIQRELDQMLARRRSVWLG
jgi:1-acyl-sn-glycerol-3-phosphate acyltransferase